MKTTKKDYQPPCVSVCGVTSEDGILVKVSVRGQLEDWEIDSDPVGSLEGDGGDIYIF